MADDLWTTIEDAVLAALKAELDSQVKTLATYQGDWLADLHREDWRFPAVLVQLRQSRGEQVTIGSYDLNLEFTVLVLVRHLRGETAGRRRPMGSTRCWQGCERPCGTRTWGWSCNPSISIREEPLLSDQEFVVYAAHYGTALVQDL